ncbi:hypothetical protein [Bordetella hinzii]|uniref:N-acetyltransferase YedL n=1 Tax=Bordetella hinzii OH87 BAL007II TaxID=1331262 RepID=A0ABR4R297_9BORD|nr:hypothetical protein [Bordetella hinzii]KCB24572.1 hypothetical protein L544_1932 [Bordetella hinzii OH87 BAL007II]KCB34447.1 hypothetical protein L541_4813 [Bordetella hinzii CA90 BAL1384]KCB39283.1 hypothetical protein L539_2241 [Bordetella hinzii 5132]QDJ43377.1 hypothetical protein CBR70_19885 [Bordetella hinzii]QDJ47951.1 hypothetical protein CBR71_20150 [Bordetella hinzii]
MTRAPDLFDPAVLAAWTRLASDDAFVARHAILADLRLGLRNTSSGQALWLSADGKRVQGGPGLDGVAFTLEGPQDAFDDLARGFPFNRLVRQHRLTVGGDMRRCVQNWLLVYAITRLTARLNPQEEA